MAPRTKGSVRAVESTRRNALLVVLWFLVVHLAALTQFSRGFLLSRPVLEDRSTVPSLTAAPFDRAVILIVDALRYDFVQTPEDAPEHPWLRHFPVQEIAKDPKHGFTARFLADPPTTTLQRLKGLTTGSLPAFIDAGANFAGFKIEEDNWVSQAAAHLGPISFVGDDTWEALYSHEFNVSYPFPSLNVRDLHTVDNGVKQWMPAMIKNSTNKIVIGHMLGVDHVGHRYGPAHQEMSEKLDETFNFVLELAEAIDDRTVLIVMGDHGMDQTGNHGGDSPDELEAALWMYSKRPIFSTEGAETVRQIDIVPTISGLLGLPIPFNSLGFPIAKAFTSDDYSMLKDATKRQLQAYTERVGSPSTKSHLEMVDQISAELFQQKILHSFEEAWIEFDTWLMYSGITLLLLAILLSFALYTSNTAKSLPGVAKSQSLGALLGLVAGMARYFTSNEQPILLLAALDVSFFTAVGIVLFSLVSCLKLISFSRPSSWTVFSIALLGLEVATNFSNSFVIWESYSSQFFLATVIVVLGLASLRTKSPIVIYLGLWYVAVLLVILRLSSSWVVCREETVSRCNTTFYEKGSSLVPTWTSFAVGILGFSLPFILQRFWAIGRNYVGTAQLLINMTSLAMFFVVGYWSLDNAEARGWISSGSMALQGGKIILARLSLAFGCLGGMIIWWRSNLPIEIVLKKGRPERIEGFNNIHGAYALLTLVCLFWSFSVSQKPPAILSLAALLYTCLGLLDFVDITETKYTMLVPLAFDMLSHGYFYFTGHQATIPSIQWDMAFIASRSVSYFWSPITVFLNTFSPFLICAISCVFSGFWRRPPFKDPVQPVAFCLRAALGLLTVSGVRTVGSLIAACLLRRHLMAWKIFAPRFMFGAMSLVAIDVACIIGITLGGHTIKKVTEMFGTY